MRHFLFIILLTIFSCKCNAQALAKAESMITNKMEMLHIGMKNPAEHIYDLSWENKGVHIYKNLETPNNYEVNLTDFSMPIHNGPIKVTSNFGYRKNFGRNHYGIDLKCYIGDTIYATFSGKIRVVDNEPRGYGKYIVIRHYNGFETIYGHLSKQLVKPNEYVNVGDPIGLGGNTGRSTGSHLHLEIRFGALAIDPALIFDFSHLDIIEDKYKIK